MLSQSSSFSSRSQELPPQGRIPQPGRLRRLLIAALVGAVALLVAGCEIIILRGPDHVRTGDRASYTVRVLASGGSASNARISLAIDVPAGWSLVRHSLVSRVSGVVSHGTAEMVSESGVPAFPSGAVPAGFQRIFLEREMVSYTGDDFVDVKLDFLVGGPAGTYELHFWTAGEESGGSTPGDDATKTVVQTDAPGGRTTTTLDQPSVRGSNYFSDAEREQIGAEDVVIDSRTGSFFVRRLEVVGLYAEDPASSLFSVAVYQDSEGLPGSLVAGFSNLVVSPVDTGSEVIGFTEELFLLNLPSVLELPNGVYWISVVDQTPAADFGWIESQTDSISGRAGAAFAVGGGPWGFYAEINASIRIVGSEDPILYQEPFETSSVLATGLSCGDPSAGDIQIGNACPWSAFAPTPNATGAWGNETCTNYGSAQHRASFTTPVIDLSACPAGTQAVVEMEYLLELHEIFEFERTFLDATIDGTRQTVATNRSYGPPGEDACSARPEYHGLLVEDRTWRHLTVPVGTGSTLVLDVSGEVVDAIDNVGVGLLVDDLWVRCGSELFFDGFERGNSNGWTVTVP